LVWGLGYGVWGRSYSSRTAKQHNSITAKQQNRITKELYQYLYFNQKYKQL
jgi:hypothetical protein